MSMRMRITALVVGMVVLIAGWFFLGLKPAQSRLGEVKDQVETTRQEITALQARLARLQALKANEEQLREDAERMAKGLPTRPAVSDFIRQVQQSANEAGIDFLTIAPGVPADLAAPAAPAAPPPADGSAAAPTTTTALKVISISMTSTGSFFDTEDFVAKMEGLERAFRIDSFNLSGVSPALSLQITGRMFMGAAAPAAAPAPAASPAASTG